MACTIGLRQFARGNSSIEVNLEINLHKQTVSFEGCILKQGHAKRAVLSIQGVS